MALVEHLLRSCTKAHAIALLVQEQWRCAGLYEIAWAKLIHQNVIQAIRASFVCQLYGALHDSSISVSACKKKLKELIMPTFTCLHL